MNFVVIMTRYQGLDLGEQFFESCSTEPGASGYKWTRDREAAQRFPTAKAALAAIAKAHTTQGDAQAVPA